MTGATGEVQQRAAVLAIALGGQLVGEAIPATAERLSGALRRSPKEVDHAIRRRNIPSPRTPTPNRASVAGSGTDVATSVTFRRAAGS
jgi:hypothetical protein